MSKICAILIMLIFLAVLPATSFAEENQTIQSINEQDKCVFLDSSSEQKCSSYYNGIVFECSGTGTCTVEISGEPGKKLAWKSTCGGYSETIIDGQNDEITFKCGQVQPETTAKQAPAYVKTCADSDGGKNYDVKGTVKTSSAYESTDYCNDEKTLTEYFCEDAGDGKSTTVNSETHGCNYACRDGACLPSNAPLCGNGICESEDEKANCPKDCGIKCNQDSDCGKPTTIKSCGSPLAASAKGSYPDNYYACTSETYYKCENPGTADARCVGGGGASCMPCPQGCKNGECLATSVTPAVKVSVPTATAPCIDSDYGRNYGTKGYIKTHSGEHAEDNCENEGYLTEYYCVYEKINSDRIMCPDGCKDGACLQEPAPLEPCKDSDGTNIVTVPTGVFHPPGEDRYVKGSVTYGNIVYEDYCVKINYYNDSFGNENIKYDKTSEGTGVIEEGCLDGKIPYETSYFECIDGCRDGACIKEEIAEQIKCIFINSDKEQQCYIAVSPAAKHAGTTSCKGKDSCIITHNGNKGEQITWKSTCGGYQYTTLDGNKKEIKFECRTGETNIDEIKNKGFRSAYWQCYDGTESKSGDQTSCKPSEVWQSYAAEFCKGKCYKDNSKCGVNSFSVGNECYAEGSAAIPAVTAAAPQPTATAVAVPAQGMLYYFRGDNCTHCQAMDKEISILKQKGFFNNFGAVVYSIEDKDISQKYEIKAVPTLILYKDKCMFRKEGLMKSDEIENWAYKSRCKEETEEADKKTITEPILVCKDSCPSDGKCYPFGYRKTDKFCSDEGKFIGQLKEDEICENNFECKSNVCVDGKCLSSGLIQKIIDFIKNIFRQG